MVVDWMVVSREVGATLRRRRVDTHRAEEITQTAIMRAIGAGDSSWGTGDAVRWCVRVAVNLHVDDLRRRTATPVSELPEVAVDDVERQVFARLELARVVDALPHLTDAQRSALFEAHPDDPRERSRWSSARHRARARLRHLVDGAAGWIVTRPMIRRVLDHMETMPREAAAFAVAVVVVVQPLDFTPDHVMRGLAAPAEVVLHADPLRWSVLAAIGTVAATERVSTTSAAIVSSRDADRPDWVGHDGHPIAGVPNPSAPEHYLWWIDDDEEEADEPVVCVWNRTTALEACSPVTWGDAQDLSPVPLPPLDVPG